ncbi:MAG TPA: hypothetical protein VGD01_01360 [Candidatus Elarobacter sp.]
MSAARDDKRRSRRFAVAFVVLGLVWGYVTTVALDAAGVNGFFSAAAIALVVGAFAWLRRSRELDEIFMPAIAIAYAAYVGIALARVGDVTLPGASFAQLRVAPLLEAGPMAERWPIVLAAGIPFALFFAVAVAWPVSMLPDRRKRDPHAHDAFWSAVADINTAAAAPPARPADRPDRDAG